MMVSMMLMGGGLAVTFGRMLEIIPNNTDTMNYSWGLVIGGMGMFIVFGVLKLREMQNLSAKLEHISTMIDDVERAARGRKGVCGLHGEYEGRCKKCTAMKKHGICPMHGRYDKDECPECLKHTKKMMSKYPRRDDEEGSGREKNGT